MGTKVNTKADPLQQCQVRYTLLRYVSATSWTRITEVQLLGACQWLEIRKYIFVNPFTYYVLTLALVLNTQRPLSHIVWIIRNVPLSQSESCIGVVSGRCGRIAARSRNVARPPNWVPYLLDSRMHLHVLQLRWQSDLHQQRLSD